MPPRPKSWRILTESRRQACVAVDFYNRSGDRRSYHDFVMHMHTAWLYLLHAEFERGKVDYIYRNARGHALKTKDGDKKFWDLEKCVKERFSDTDAVRANLEFLSACGTRSSTGARTHSSSRRRAWRTPMSSITSQNS